jgi:hypothetical protein
VTVTFAMVRDIDLAPLAGLVDRSAEFGRRCVALRVEFETDVAGRLVRSGWQGEAAQQALRVLDQPDDTFEWYGLQQASAAAALGTLHSRLSRLQAQAWSIVDEARDRGLTVSGNGELWGVDPGGTVRLRKRIDALLAEANRLDDEFDEGLRRCGPAGLGRADDFCWERAREAAQQAGAPLGIAAAAIPADDQPAAARAWWAGLTAPQRDLYLVAFPERIGALDGLPSADRDRANRLALRIAHGISLIARDPRGAHRSQDLIDQLEAAQFDPAGPPLLLLDVDNRAADGLAVVAVGDPDTSRHQAVVIPGVDSTVDRMNGELDRAGRLRAAADALTPSVDGDVAVIAWLGYDAPEQDASALGGARADDGAARLSRFVDTLHQTAPGHLTVLGHSYGSTVVGVAAARDGMRVDDIITAGSPGLRVRTVGELHLDPHHVWAGAARGDDVSGWMSHFAHGPAPHTDAFGANRFHVDTVGHSAYWDPDTVSLTNQASIVVGQYDRVSLDHGTAPSTMDS